VNNASPLTKWIAQALVDPSTEAANETLNPATRTFGMSASLLKYWKLFWPVVAPIVSLPKPNEKHGCQQAGAATILIILPTARSQRAVFFRRRCSLSFIISFKSATGRISIGPSPYLKPGCCEIS
jgi:hypothetical protein